MAISKDGNLKRFNAYITKKQHERLILICEESNECISSHIRKAVDVYFSHYENEKAIERAIKQADKEAYERRKR